MSCWAMYFYISRESVSLFYLTFKSFRPDFVNKQDEVGEKIFKIVQFPTYMALLNFLQFSLIHKKYISPSMC